MTSGFDTAARKKPHVLLIPVGGSGHIAPFVQILYHLAERCPGLTVTLLCSKALIPQLSHLQEKGGLHNVDLHLVEVFGPPPVYHADPKFPVRGAMVGEMYREQCASLWRNLVKDKDVVGAPTAIIADMFLYWSKDLADELDVPCYLYFPASSMYALCSLLVPTLLKEGLHPYTSPNAEKLLTIPGLTFIRIQDIPEEMFAFPEFYTKLSDRMRRVTGILLNTAEELETAAGSVKALMNGTSRVLQIGPSMQYPGFGYIYTPTDSASNCLKWLDSHPASSVLYVAFGSIGSISRELITSLAVGLEASGVPFLWALKVGSAELSDVLPLGFEDRTRGRGVIETSWTPQSRILAHPSTGGFLSHCGWNSSLESIVTGVPLITWPLSADQLMNARLIVDMLKVGVSISSFQAGNTVDDYENISSEDVERTVRLLMVEERGRELRRNASEVQKSVTAAVAEGGSSYETLHSFLEEITSV